MFGALKTVNISSPSDMLTFQLLKINLLTPVFLFKSSNKFVWIWDIVCKGLKTFSFPC